MSEKNGKVYTISDIAEYAGVSRSTVSRVLNNVRTKVTVSEATRAKIQEAIRHFDYTPNENARRLSVNRSFVIGLQLPCGLMPNNYIFSDYNLIGALQGVESALRGTGYRLQLLFGSCMGTHTENVRLLKNKSLDGVIIWGALKNEKFSEELHNYPVIMVNSMSDLANFRTIIHDDFTGSFELTKDIIAAGAKKFLYVKGPENVTIVEERFNGFCAALAAAGLNVTNCCDICNSTFTYDSVSDKAREIFANPESVAYDAIVCVNDTTATAFYDSAAAAGFVPQRDIIIAGADGADDCARYNLLTYKCDRFRMGKEAIEDIIGIIEGKKLAKLHKRLAVEHIKRQFPF